MAFRIPIVSKLIAKHRVRSADAAVDKLAARAKKVEAKIEKAQAAVDICCPDSIHMKDRVQSVRDKMREKLCKIPARGRPGEPAHREATLEDRCKDALDQKHGLKPGGRRSAEFNQQLRSCVQKGGPNGGSPGEEDDEE